MGIKKDIEAIFQSFEKADSNYARLGDILVAVYILFLLMLLLCIIIVFLISPYSLLDWGWARVLFVFILGGVLSINYYKENDTED